MAKHKEKYIRSVKRKRKPEEEAEKQRNSDVRFTTKIFEGDMATNGVASHVQVRKIHLQ